MPDNDKASDRFSQDIPGAAPILTPEAKLDRALQDRLTWEVRTLYDELLGEPIPDRLLALLDANARRKWH
jgi:Anti-sigma factor NepR